MREFVSTSVFDRFWSDLGLSDEDLRRFQNYLLQSPGAGDVIEGTGGAIKARFALPGKGKRGGVRVICFDLASAQKLYLLTCYPKSKQSNLSVSEKAAIKEVVKRIIKREKEGLG